MNTEDPKYQQKSKAISSAEPNYFVHFAMRHPVYAVYSMKNINFVPFLFLSSKINLKTCSLKNQKVGAQAFKKRFSAILNYVLNT